jgi:acetolactate synthase I/II/III large subunit
MLGMHGAAATNHALHRSDLLVVLGARFDDRATGRLAEFCPDAQVIHLDIDASEIHKLRRAEVPLRGDLGLTLEKLLKAVTQQQRESWWEEIAGLRQRYPVTTWGAALERPQDLIRRVGLEMGPDAVVVTDVGQHQMWTAQVYPFSRPRQWLTSGGLGTMGFGLPSAIGAALADPQRPVVCFTGDGSILMNIQELATATHYNLNIKLVLLNNRALGLVRQQQDLFYGGNRFASGFDREVRFCEVAKGFGWETLDLGGTAADLRSLVEVLRKPGPQFIHVPINGEERVYPMVPPGGANHQMLIGAEHEC